MVWNDRRMERNSNWKGGIITEPSGRVLVRQINSTYRYRYRLIMEKHISRKLKRSEIIHHINGDVSDDRIENLLLLSQDKHASLHGRNTLPEIHKKKGRSGKENGFFGKKHSEESLRKIKESAKKRKPPHTGAVLSDKTRRKISESLKKRNQKL